MKFHNQIKLDGFTQAEIKETLKSNGLKFRRMRQEYSWQEKLELTNGFAKVQFLIEDDLLEIRGNGSYDVWSWVGTVTKYFKQEVVETRYTKSDIGYEREGWTYQRPSGEKIDVVQSSDEIQ